MSATIANEATRDRPADALMRRLLRVEPLAANGAAAQGRRLLTSSIAFSGLRCLITYLALPLLGPGAALGGASLLLTIALGAVAIFFSVQSMRRFWSANHRHRWAYTGFAVVIIGWVFVDVALRLVA